MASGTAAHPGYWVLPLTRASASLTSARGWDRGDTAISDRGHVPHVKFTKGEKKKAFNYWQTLEFQSVDHTSVSPCEMMRIWRPAPTKVGPITTTGILKSPTMPRWLSGSLALDTQFCVWVRTSGGH